MLPRAMSRVVTILILVSGHTIQKGRGGAARNASRKRVHSRSMVVFALFDSCREKTPVLGGLTGVTPSLSP